MQIVNDITTGAPMGEAYGKQLTPAEAQRQALHAYVSGVVSPWRDHIRQNYTRRWLQYDRLWQCMHSDEDRTRASERSTLVTPATMQAVDSWVAEIHEATFGNSGDFFDIVQDTPLGSQGLPEAARVGFRREIRRRFAKDGVVDALDEVLQLSGIYGSGFAEVVLDRATDRLPSIQGNQVGMLERRRVAVKLVPVNPRNVLAPPYVARLEDGPGVAIEQYMNRSAVQAKMDKGQWRKCEIPTDTIELELAPVQGESLVTNNSVKTLRYFGLVPANLLSSSYTPGEANDSAMVEACVVIIGGEVVYAKKNPYMSQRRPVLHFPADRVPGRLWGRGVAERASSMQSALDAQVRAHLDSLPFTAFPVFATDSTRLPRGFRFELYPGRNIPVSGDVSQAIQRVDMGPTNPAFLQTAEGFERMLLQATGTLDSAALPSLVKGGTDPTALQMALAGVVKKNRRALTLFHEHFLAPFIEEAAQRFVQFEPEVFAPVADLTFRPVSSLGILAREFEASRYIALLQTLGPQSPIVPLVVARIVELSALADREELVGQLKKIGEQMANDPAKAEQAQMEAMRVAIEMRKATAEADLKEAQARKALVDAATAPAVAQAQLIAAMTKNMTGSPGDPEFERRVQLVDLLLRAQKIDNDYEAQVSNERVAAGQAVGPDGTSAQGRLEEMLARMGGALEDQGNRMGGLMELLAAPEEIVRDEQGRPVGKRRVMPQGD
ncbi:hypothetical protein UFOVP411_6 [uncultured Caudovirales phage]|uniref:Uncharacterized protein n=1 Tax=uncultured Caudovirales phage TaxID=2100421 RepID=A0A6J5M789_9CAUD|nr:hypothetical protein UFOVP411_6 [uncultured Caudovirales phage]